MNATNATELEMYQIGGERIVAAATAEGRALASQVLAGPRADAEAAEPCGFAVSPENDDQRRHLAKHGWYQPA